MVIVGTQCSPTERVLNELRTSCYEFHLTGSRFFGNVNEESDWDFFVQPSSLLKSDWGLESFLKSLGFEQISYAIESDTAGYGDASIYCIFHHQEANIHVQLLYPGYASLKVKIQEILKRDPYYLHCDKVERRNYWRFAWQLLASQGVLPS